MKFSSSPNRPEAWKEMKLVDICKTFTSGGTPSRKRPEYFENGIIPWVRTKELNDGIITEVEEFITPEALKNSSAKLLPKNTVLLAMYGATVGKLGVLGFESSCNQACAAMVPKDDVVDYRYLYYLLLNHRELIISQATGGAQQNLSGELIKGFTFDFPTYKEQQAISEILWKIDEKIAVNNALSKTLEDIAQTIFKSWFIDFDPVKAKMAGEKPAGMDAATAALFPDSMEESQLGLIPKGWDIACIGDVSNIYGGKMLSRDEFSDDGIFPIFGGAGVMGNSNRSNAEGFVITVGRVGAYCGQFFYHRGSAWVNNNASRIIPRDGISGEWMYQFLKSFDIESIKKGAAQPFVSNSDLAKSKLLVPPLEVIQRFTDVMRPIFEQSETLENQARLLTKLRDSLLPRLISGELLIAEEMLAS